MRRNFRLVFALVALPLLIGSFAGPASAQVANPRVTGPIPENAPPGDPSHDYTFFSTVVDLAPFGYVQEEFFFEGSASRFETPRLATGRVLDSDHPYKTRMVVRRPASPEKFNGVVLVEWQNVTAGFDVDAQWLGSNQHFMREGYVWVGVSVQRVGVQQADTGLTAFSPGRYGTLDVTDGGTITTDALSFDIYSQAGQALKNPSGVDPLQGLRPQVLIAMGASQSAARLTTYYNSVQPLANVYDGLFLLVGGGPVRTDLGVKVFKVLSESDVPGQAANLQPDSDMLRTWQVAGAAHADKVFTDGVAIHGTRDGVPVAPTDVCDRPANSELRFSFVQDKVYDDLVRWVRTDVAPAIAPPLELATLGPPAVIARDERGFAKGGIQIADFAVPTALNTGNNTGPSFCRLFGVHIPFDRPMLDALYPTHAGFVARVSDVTMRNLEQGFIPLGDAMITVRDAERSSIGADLTPMLGPDRR